jgi:predicted nucleic acid-binding protein
MSDLVAELIPITVDSAVIPVHIVITILLIQLIRDEHEHAALRTFVGGADLICWDVALTELPRATRRAAWRDPGLGAGRLLTRAGDLVDGIALLPIDRALLLAAGSLDEPSLRALDAIHIATAIDVSPVDGFLTYDERQAASARLAGLRTVMPGV